MPPAGKPYAGTGGDGNLRPIPVSAALGDSAQSYLRARGDRGPRAAGAKRRSHQIARQMVQMARYSGDGDVSPFVSATAVQPKREKGSVGRPEEGLTFCV